ncbi:hypothetical protein Daus18300_013815 [Diaporthe australafricana]|uniref:Uncharacterized protein n=1 Tax=Diaporthe australafricana TaxID=127596 RepID=A0ABR3VXL9_9PEZI
MDIRSRPLEEWGDLLGGERPRPIDDRLGWTPQEASAVFCAIVANKTIVRYTNDTILAGVKSRQGQEEVEKKNALLRYAWMDTAPGVEEDMDSKGQGDPVFELQTQLYAELMEPEGDWAPALSNGVTFEGIMESQPMLEHFWSRFAAENENGRVIVRRVSDGIMPLENAALAQKSLVHWCSERRSLSETLMTIPNGLVDGGNVSNHVLRWSMSECACVRVLYDPGLEKDGPGHHDLVHIEFSPMFLDTSMIDVKWSHQDMLKYRLVSAVRMGSRDTCDKVMIHDVRGGLSRSLRLIPDDDWQLGQKGFKYMLYYVPIRRTRDSTALAVKIKAEFAAALEGPSIPSELCNICSLPATASTQSTEHED